MLLALAFLPAAAVPAAPAPLKPILVAKGLPSITAVVCAPSERSRLYVVGRAGVVRVIDRGKLLPRPFLNIASRVPTAGEMGLLSIAFDPRYATNRYVYTAYTTYDRQIVVSRFTVAADVAKVGSELVLVRVDHPDSPYHNGGQLTFGPDGRLYVGVGDGGYISDPPNDLPDPHGNGQNLDVLLGKIFRIDLGSATPAPEIVAYGLRNPWRFSFAPNGDLMIGDVGWRTAEEIDVLPHGSGLVNFGWSTYEGRTTRTGGPPLNPAGALVFPAYEYRTHIAGNCSVIGGYVYRGRYVFGDYCSGRIWTGPFADGRIGPVRALPFRIPRLTTFGETASGTLYAGTAAGTLYRLAP